MSSWYYFRNSLCRLENVWDIDCNRGVFECLAGLLWCTKFWW